LDEIQAKVLRVFLLAFQSLEIHTETPTLRTLKIMPRNLNEKYVHVRTRSTNTKYMKGISVGDPDPQDPHVFGPPGSGSTRQRYGSGSFPFPINALSGLKKWLTK
jgi:hypothetical protein